MAKMLHTSYSTRQRRQKCRWCSRFDGALLPTSFEGLIEDVSVAHTRPTELVPVQYQVLPFLRITHLSPSMVEGSTSSSPRASDADDGFLDGWFSALCEVYGFTRGRPAMFGGRARVVHIFAVEVSSRVENMDDQRLLMRDGADRGSGATVHGRCTTGRQQCRVDNLSFFFLGSISRTST